jgi:predicted O-linked N-acetylglucosamine transferase (SPINDLY family)
MEVAAQGMPGNAGIWVNLGMMRSTTGNIAGAEDAFEHAVEVDPRNVDGHLCLGILLANDQRTGPADSHFRQALSLAPTRIDIAHSYSRTLADTARTDEALAIIREAQRHAAHDLSLQDKVCCLLNYIAGIPPEQILAEHVKFGKMVGSPPPMHHVTDRNPDRKLRVGYLSGDLREHSVTYFFESLLENHDRSAFEVWCYHVGAPHERTTPRLKAKSDQWRFLFPVSDDALDRAIADDRIDILVELAGHAQGNRLTAVARAPAPVNVTYLGYPNTTGVPAIHYRIVDDRTDPRGGGSDRWATETLIRLPECFLCYRPPESAPDVAVRPGVELPTFGSFNNLAKLSPPTLELWGRLLARVPGSRFILKGKGLGDDSVRSRVLGILGKAGISPELVELFGHIQTTAEHLALYGRIDIALDPFPYCGTTTTCEALWMGVPVVTLAGSHHVSRVGVSLLETVGLPDLIAKSEDEYLTIAAALAADPSRRADLRSSLRDRIRRSALCDGPGHARRIEAAYRRMWHDWCAAPQ